MLNNFVDKIKLPFRKDKELYSSLCDIIGCYPHNISYYKLALMHKSAVHHSVRGKPANNERLEFLGDAILDAIVGDIVFRHFPGKREGFLTNTRSKIVQRDTLNRLAKEMGITRLILSEGHNNSHNSYLGGNAFEALVGALYLDRGYDACRRFMEKRILGELINIDKVAYKEVNFKSRLIEWVQKNHMEISFDMLGEKTDEKGSPIFRFQVVIEGVPGGEGKGFSKKESQQIAAGVTLKRLRDDKNFVDCIFAAKKSRIGSDMKNASPVPETEKDSNSVTVQDMSNSNTDNVSADSGDGQTADFKTLILEDSKRAAERNLQDDRVMEEAFESDTFSRSELVNKENIVAAAEAQAFGVE